MDYLYGKFSNKQILEVAHIMHSDIHKLLLYKDKYFTEKIFDNDEDFIAYFENLLFKFGGLNSILGEPDLMIVLMSTLKAAYNETQKESFNYRLFRKAILDSHGYIKAMFEEVDEDAMSENS